MDDRIPTAGVPELARPSLTRQWALDQIDRLFDGLAIISEVLPGF